MISMKVLQMLFSAIVMVESSNRSDAVNPKDPECVGYMQMKPIFVKDINRILGKEKYTLKDRSNRTKCWEMFLIFVKHYELDSVEDISLAWCLGVTGSRKAAIPEAAWRYVNRVEDDMLHQQHGGDIE